MKWALAGTQESPCPNAASGTVDSPAAMREATVPVQPQHVGNGGLAPSSLVELAVQRATQRCTVPGERLIEEQLTRWFGGTSRAPLREVAGVPSL